MIGKKDVRAVCIGNSLAIISDAMFPTVKNVRQLLQDLAIETKFPLNYSGFRRMEELFEAHADINVQEITGRYLYEVSQKLKEAGENPENRLSVHVFKMDCIAKFLGYLDFAHYCRSRLLTPAEELLVCEGLWYSYVRSNFGDFLLQAPVRIYKTDQPEMWMELKGKEHHFKGRLIYRTQCLFTQLEADKDKVLHLVFKLGPVKRPMLLQGVFTGISSAGDPIAGRELLIREENAVFEDMKWQQVPLEEIKEKRLYNYFKETSGNNIKINKAAAFDWEDLTG